MQQRSARCPVRRSMRLSRAVRSFAESLESRLLLSTYTVTNTNDSGPGSLRDAIQNSLATTLIVHASGTITLSSQLEVSRSLTISGPGAGMLAVSGGNAVRVFQVDAGATVEIDGITITSGRAPTGSTGTPAMAIGANGNPGGAGGDGGGVLSMGVLTLAHDSITNNVAGTGGMGGLGGDNSDSPPPSPRISGGTGGVGGPGGMGERSSTEVLSRCSTTPLPGTRRALEEPVGLAAAGTLATSRDRGVLADLEAPAETAARSTRPAHLRRAVTATTPIARAPAAAADNFLNSLRPARAGAEEMAARFTSPTAARFCRSRTISMTTEQAPEAPGRASSLAEFRQKRAETAVVVAGSTLRELRGSTELSSSIILQRPPVAG